MKVVDWVHENPRKVKVITGVVGLTTAFVIGYKSRAPIVNVAKETLYEQERSLLDGAWSMYSKIKNAEDWNGDNPGITIIGTYVTKDGKAKLIV